MDEFAADDVEPLVVIPEEPNYTEGEEYVRFHEDADYAQEGVEC